MIDWSLLLASIINLSKEHSLSMGLIKDYHKPAPSKWSLTHAYKSERGNNQYARRLKRNILDSEGRVVAEELDIPTADFLHQVTPEAVMVLMDTIDEMAHIIATQRNAGLLHPVHEPDNIRLYLLKKHTKLVRAFLRRQHQLVLRKVSKMAPESRGKRGGLKPSADRIQNEIELRQKTIDEHNKNRFRRSKEWKEKVIELGLSTRDLKELSRSRRRGSI
jgi:hypothetical protein